MIEFGPAGMDETMDAQKMDIFAVPAYLKKLGLKTFEYPLTHGTNLNLDKAKLIGDAFKKEGITLSCHAPYYINFANPDPLAFDKNVGYITASLNICRAMGADRLVFHPGSLTGQPREVAVKNTYENIREMVKILNEQNALDGLYLCPETMGKHGQIGTVEEVAQFVSIDEHLMPTIDFGHVNAFMLGGLKTEADFDQIFATLKRVLGERGSVIHGHFSRIEYGAKGELKHINFDSPEPFGPDYRALIRSLKRNNISGRIVCESRGHQSLDAATMNNEYHNIF